MRIPLSEYVLRRFRRVTASTTYIPQIDGLRCLAIAAVFVFHLQAFLRVRSPVIWSVAPNHDLLGRLAANGNFGVPIFFSISGFILALPFARRVFQGKPLELRRYLLRRVTRLEPPYIVAGILFFGLLCMVNGLAAAGLFPHLLAYLGYVHNLVYGATNPINVVAWSLEIEVQFYLLMPLLAVVFRVRDRRWRRGIFAALGALAILWQTHGVEPDGALAHSLVNFIQFFLVGLILADIYIVDWQNTPTRGFGWDVAGVACWVALIAVLAMPDVALVLTPVLLLLALGSVFRGRASAAVFSNRWVSIIGGMCYSIYLLHYQVISAVCRFSVLLSMTHYFWMNLLVQALVVTPCVLGVSAVFYLLIERPCMREHWPRELSQWLRQLATTRHE